MKQEYIHPIYIKPGPTSKQIGARLARLIAIARRNEATNFTLPTAPKTVNLNDTSKHSSRSTTMRNNEQPTGSTGMNRLPARNSLSGEPFADPYSQRPLDAVPCSAFAFIRRNKHPEFYVRLQNDLPTWTSDPMQAGPVTLRILMDELNKVAATEPEVWAVIYPQNV